LILLLLVLLVRSRKAAKALSRYKDIADIEAFKESLNKEIAKLEADKNTLKQDYSAKRAIFDSLLKEISLYEEELEITSYGLYRPHYDFDTSESYKKKLDQIRESEKSMISKEGAYYCSTEWTVSNSKVEGRKMTKHYGKLMLRAFNGESDALISNVRWNNIIKMEERLQKSFEAINKLGSSHRIVITDEYRDLKLEELRLTHEYQDKLYQEKEEQRRIREEMREEEKAQRELEKAEKEAEDEEKRYNKALEQAKADLLKAQGGQVDTLNSKIAELEKELQAAREKKERAISQAQLTKSGHVYVISNIGSFGENVFKIGMTRRLDPLDRIRELGDASVPFDFDVHAIIYTENAPDVEYKIQKRFEDRRLNLVNNRREFFNAALDEIELAAKEFKADIEFTKLAEARQFRESQAIREQRLLAQEQQPSIKAAAVQKFPESI
jgi:hypothetical protein